MGWHRYTVWTLSAPKTHIYSCHHLAILSQSFLNHLSNQVLTANLFIIYLFYLIFVLIETGGYPSMDLCCCCHGWRTISLWQYSNHSYQRHSFIKQRHPAKVSDPSPHLLFVFSLTLYQPNSGQCSKDDKISTCRHQSGLLWLQKPLLSALI